MFAIVGAYIHIYIYIPCTHHVYIYIYPSINRIPTPVFNDLGWSYIEVTSDLMSPLKGSLIMFNKGILVSFKKGHPFHTFKSKLSETKCIQPHHDPNYDLGGGNSNIFIFLPIPGEMIQFDEHIFQRGWFNHQLDDGHFTCFSLNDLCWPAWTPFEGTPCVVRMCWSNGAAIGFGCDFHGVSAFFLRFQSVERKHHHYMVLYGYMVYLPTIYHKNQPNIDKSIIHGWYCWWVGNSFQHWPQAEKINSSIFPFQRR